MIQNKKKSVCSLMAIVLLVLTVFISCGKANKGDIKGTITYNGSEYKITNAYLVKMNGSTWDDCGPYKTWFHLETKEDVFVVAEICRKNSDPSGTYTHEQNSWLLTVEVQTGSTINSQKCLENAYVDVKSLGDDRYQLTGHGITTKENKSVEFSFEGTVSNETL